MPRKPFQAEIIRIYEPDMDRMVRALEAVRDYNPRKEQANAEASGIQGKEPGVCKVPGSNASLAENVS